MSEKYRLIKHNKNLAEIENDRGVGLLFLVDEDCERKLEIIVDLLNEKESIIQRLALENENLRKQVGSSETTSNVTSNYNAHLESKISTLEKENEQLQTQLLICQQSKNDDGRIKVWQVPPIPKGKRMTFSTTKRSDRI